MDTVIPRANNIDAIRLILSLLVLFSHSYPLGTGTEDHEPLKLFSRGQITLGGLAVDGFFILSGFLICQSWQRSRNSRIFLMRRVRRIYPAYIVAVAICTWIVTPLAGPGGKGVFSWETVKDATWSAMRLNFPRVPDVFISNPAPHVVNGSLWSISYEFWCYIGVMVLGSLLLLRRKGFILALLIFSIFIHFVFERYDLRTGGKILGTIFGYPRFWARLLPLYLAGVAARLYEDKLRLSRGGAALALAGLALAARLPYGIVFAIPTLGTYLLLYLAFTTDWTWHDAARRGDFSYGIYLYAFPVQQLVMQALGRPVSPFVLFALALPPTVSAGMLSWFLVERRFLAGKAHAEGGKPSGRALSRIRPRGGPTSQGTGRVI